jgi:hypothetical protein
MQGDVHSISLRLGRNTIIQNYISGQRQHDIDRFGCMDMGDYIKYNFKRHPAMLNYGYTYSLDFQLYRTDSLAKTFEEIEFYNPRSLESKLNSNTLFREVCPNYMICPATSNVFVNTINCVQAEGPPAGTKYAYSIEELNKRFLLGEQPVLRIPSGYEIMGCHDELPLEFIWSD